MATLSVLKFNDLNGADRVLLALQGLQERQMITLEDAAVVSWPLECVMNSIRNGLGMRETEIAREPS
jgi:uncharacterized membrane protein